MGQVANLLCHCRLPEGTLVPHYTINIKLCHFCLLFGRRLSIALSNTPRSLGASTVALLYQPDRKRTVGEFEVVSSRPV